MKCLIVEGLKLHKNILSEKFYFPACCLEVKKKPVLLPSSVSSFKGKYYFGQEWWVTSIIPATDREDHISRPPGQKVVRLPSQ
jgi:hypothetical protein